MTLDSLQVTFNDLPWQEERRMVKFMQYATIAAKEALDDAGWHPQSSLEQETTVDHMLFSERR